MARRPKDPRAQQDEILQEAVITSSDAFARDFAETSHDFLLGEKESISEDLAQLKSFMEKVYEDALHLRSGTRKGEEREMLRLSVETNLQRLEDRLQAYQVWIAQGNPLRRHDFLDVDVIDVSSEKIAAILAIESGDGKLPDMSKVKAKRQKATEERRKQAMKAGACESGHLSESRETQGFILELRRTKFKQDTEKEKAAAEEKSWQIMKHCTKVFLLVLALAFVPISYFAFGRADLSGPQNLEPRTFRDVMEMSRVYEKNHELTVVTVPHWKNLMKREKTIQMQSLVKKVTPRLNRIKVVDEMGYVQAEYRMGEILIY